MERLYGPTHFDTRCNRYCDQHSVDVQCLPRCPGRVVHKELRLLPWRRRLAGRHCPRGRWATIATSQHQCTCRPLPPLRHLCGGVRHLPGGRAHQRCTIRSSLLRLERLWAGSHTMVPGWLDAVSWLIGMRCEFATGSSSLLCDGLASALLQLCFVIRCWFGQLVRNWFAALSGLALGYLVLSFSVGSLLVMGWFAASSWPGPWLASRCWLAHRVCGRFVGFAWWSKLVSVLLERSLRFGAGSRAVRFTSVRR